MIEFEKIRYKNLLLTGNVPIEISLNTHPNTLFVGDNGVGKSTILDALFFALFGVSFRDINKGQLVNSINNKDMLVELWFKTNNISFFIRRGMKPNIFEIYENDNLIDQPAIIREYQEIIEKRILRMNQEACRQIVVLGSSSFVPFMKLKAAERREVIENILDIKIFSTMFTLLKNNIQNNRDNFQEVEHQIDLVEQKLELHTKHLESLKQNNEAIIESKFEKKKEHDEEIAKHQTEITKYLLKINGKDGLNDSIVDEKKVEITWAKQSEWDEKLTEKLIALSKEIEFLENNNNCPTCKQDINEEFKNLNLKEKKTKAKEIQKALADLYEKLEELSNRKEVIAAVKKEVDDINNLIADHTNEIKMFQQFNQHLGEEIEGLKIQTEKEIVDETETVKIKNDLLAKYRQKEELIINKQVLDVASSILKDGGIKSVLIKQYVPIMNKLINKYLNDLGANYGFEMDENFTEKIKSRFRDEFTYGSFSDGQKLRIDVALLFTWRAIAKLRNSASTNLLIMDEILDRSLDYAGTEEFLKLIQLMTKNTNTIIISHKIDQLTDKFDNVVKFEISKNFTKMSQGEAL